MKKHFKKLFNLSSTLFVLPNLWDLVCDITDDRELGKIEILVRKIQFQFQTDSIDSYLQFEVAFLEDIIILKMKYKDSRIIENLNYLQMSIFTNSLGYFNSQGLFTYTYDSIILSVHDSKIDYRETIQIEHDRFLDFLYSVNPHIKINSKSLLIDWFTHLYYYSYSFGGHVNFGFDFWYYAIYLSMKTDSFDIEKNRLLSNMMTWSRLYKKSNELEIRNFIIEENKKINWDSDLKQDIYIQLIIIKDLNKEYRIDLYNELKSKVKLKGHIELQLLVALIDDIHDIDLNYNQIINATKQYNDFIKSNTTNPILLTNERARIFKVLHNLIILLIEENRIDQLTNLLGAYYDIINELDTSILYIFPYSEIGVFYSTNEKMELDKLNSYEISKELIKLSNLLFNRAISLIGDKESIPIPQRIMGIPSNIYADEFESKVLELYNFEIVKKSFSENINGMILLGFNSIPIQYLMLKEIGFTYPISISLCKPFEEAKIERVLIVANGTLTSLHELSALIYICDNFNILYEVMAEDQISKEEFVKLYCDEKFSMIWIATHGEHNNYEPQKSKINLSEKVSIYIDELVTLPMRNKNNRLLVMNLCESGLNSELGGFKGIGFSHQLTSSQQSIISHLWMVEPKMAMTFGLLLSIGLIAENKKYFDAYCNAVLTLIKGKEYTLTVLKREFNGLTDVLDRIVSIDENSWNDLLSIGSSAFYQ